MTVTAIEKSGKRGRAAVYCGGELFGLLEWDTVRKMGLHVGDEISEEELSEAVAACSRKFAREKALSIVARREVCRKMLLSRLTEEFPEDIAEDAADYLESGGLLSDERYARLYAEKLFDKGFYIRRVVFELCGKGIDRELAEAAARRAAPDDEYEALYSLVASRKFGYVDFTDGKSVRRLTALLYRNGYDSDVIREVIRDYIDGE